jgi:tetratricopeptide (TPR) repeat protein
VPFFKTSSAIPAVVGLTLTAGVCLLTTPVVARRAPSSPPPQTAFQPAESLEGNYLAAYIAGTARDTAAAAAFYREALRADPSNAELLERAFVSFLADGTMPEAFRTAERLIQRDQSNGLAHLTLGVRDIKARQYASARNHLNRGGGRGRAADLTATLLTAWALAGGGDGKRALETTDKLKGERTYNVFRDYHAGLIANLMGNTAEAERRLKAAYEAEKTNIRFVDAFARFESRRARKDVAMEAYTGYDALLPRHPMIRNSMEQLQAGKTLAPLISTAPEGAAEVLYMLGAAGNQTGDELPAIIYLRLALHLNPDHSLALVTLADIYERLKRIDRAIEVFNRIPESSPVRLGAELQIGLALEQLGRGDEATAHLDSLMKKHPDDVEVITALGNVLRSRKRYADAAEVYSRAIARIPNPDRSHWTLFYYRGSAYERSKQWAKAEADLKKALELVPDSPPSGKAQVLNYLGYSWVDAGTNLDDAFKMLKRAIDLSPRDGMIIDSLGWAYYRLGHYEDAVRELEKAVELKPGDPVINDHLGDAYWRVGRRLEARFQWQHAKDSSPEAEDLENIVRKLENGLGEERPAAAETEHKEAQKNGG